MNESKYWRSQRGAMVHRDGCPSQSQSFHMIEWRWAAGKSLEQIVAESAEHGITHQWCKRCCPEGNAS